jgi:hypothetical protein
MRLAMREKIEAATISRRRAFWILGLGAAFGMGMPAAVLTAPDAEAQTPGMERRQDRATIAETDVTTGVPIAKIDVTTGVPIAKIDVTTAAAPLGRRTGSLRCT